ncbi:hypothetical protein U0035_21180 [Niabella yanshanensis]|uniref:Uncharacterized protein n=1 Tax=Niabella yanshanensis TaxID=577386 RepID=A0ABZ0W807_9BACT|nr:hypothetical protein [Niabella yanshanensis]WQD38186.1 hypothetical protein U0035_21180 [Niabella yanshanensis]
MIAALVLSEPLPFWKIGASVFVMVGLFFNLLEKYILATFRRFRLKMTGIAGSLTYPALQRGCPILFCIGPDTPGSPGTIDPCSVNPNMLD